MSLNWNRRTLLGMAGASVPVALAQRPSDAAGNPSKTVKIIGVACSPRKDRTTAAAMRACLEAAKGVGTNIEIEMIDLGGMKINGDLAAGVPLAPGDRDDFPKIEAKMLDPNVAGIIVGTPVYFSNMSSLCKAFLDRWMVFRRTFALRNKVGGALAVGAARNGGQELTLQSLHAAMLCHDMVIVSEGRPTSRLGGILVSTNDDISKDETGLATARSLGRRVAEVALLLRKASA
ncbi:MAG: flavodoxin family protein [Acidobacteria bacterium]|nr:flavodoxin family protein [Acidobacteriota bacterium]